ncbi:dTDP-4-dehydrorhamnose reductase [Picosynechococcus sp. PCC 7003]|nr:dTDP-4-dehydrorhamnose reductase [Picosynechococcus sp. PCC 7003]
MKVLITGANGQLGQALIALAPTNYEVIALSRRQLDITDRTTVLDRIGELKPDWVINAAAYTAVDRAEQEVEQAFAVNGQAPGYLAEALANTGGRLLHISTDFVFDGQRSTPYPPTAPPNPLNVYGESKLMGEQMVQTCLGDASLIVRTAWVYDGTHRNFVTTMLRLMEEQQEVRVVADQVGTPTATSTLANTLWLGIRQRWYGIYHATDAGIATWYDFAVAIQHYGRQLNLLEHSVPIVPITTAEFPTTACRPAYSVLDKSSTWEQLQELPLHWQPVLYEQLLGLMMDGSARTLGAYQCS